MSRIKEIEERLSAIAKEAETDGADLEALNKETDELMEERSGIIAREESRKALLEKVANGSVGTPSDLEVPISERSEEMRLADDFVKNNRMVVNAPEMRSVLLSGGTIATPTKVSGINDLVSDVPSLHGCGKEVMTTFNVTFNIYTSGQNKKQRSAEINAELTKLLTESGFVRRSGSFGLSNDFPRYYHRITEFYTVADNAT